MTSIESGDGIASMPPPPKRRRVYQACQQCRTRKERCEGSQPCQSCKQSGQTCTYKPTVKRRGLAPGYVRLLEALLGMVLVKVTDGETTTQSLLNKCIREIDAERRSEYQQVWRKSSLQTEIEECLPDIEFLDERELNSRKTRKPDAGASATPATEEVSMTWNLIALNENSDVPEHLPFTTTDPLVTSSACADALDFSASQINGQSQDRAEARAQSNSDTVPSSIDFRNAASYPLSRAIDSPAVGENSNNSSLELGVHELASGSKLCLPENAWQIIDAYFLSTHPWFPIVDKATVLQAAYLYKPGQYVTLDTERCSEHSVLWAILAYTCNQHDTADTGIDTGKEPGGSIRSIEYYTTARDMIPRDGASSHVNHVQALLLLSLTMLGHGRPSLAWILVGQAARLVIDLQPCSGNRGDLGSNPSRIIPGVQQAFLGCFVLDTLLSARLNRTPQLRTPEHLLDLLEENGLDEWDTWRGITSPGVSTHQSHPAELLRRPTRARGVFNQLCKLMAIWNDATTIVNHGNGFDLYRNVEERLRLWRSELPPFCDMIKEKDHGIALPHVMHLQMCYRTALLYLRTRMGYTLQHDTNALLETSKILDELTWLRNGYMTSFTAASAPSTFELFVHMMNDYSDDSGLASSYSKRVSTSNACESVGTVLKGSKQADLASNVLTGPNQFHRQQPRLFEEFLNLDDDDNLNHIEGDSIGLTMGTTSGAASQDPGMSSWLSNSNLIQEGSDMLTAGGEGSIAIPGGGPDFGPPLDDATLQNMLVAYGVQQ